MKKPAGLVLIASCLFILGLAVLGGDSATSIVAKLIQIVVGVTTVVAAYGLWTRRDYAMKAYWLWVVAWLVGGGAVQFMADNVPLLHVVIWWLFVGATWLAVGAYLKGALRQAA